MPETISLVQRIKPLLNAVPRPSSAAVRSIMPMLLAAIALTTLILLYVWHDDASYKPVFGVQEKVAVSDMMSVLDAEHIPYRVQPQTGQVLVPEKQLGHVRMLLAGKGVVAQLPAGLELLDKNDPLGVSQFIQDVRFRRGLEGELEQSIMALDPVSTARVHLSIAKSSSFVVNDGEKSSASVLVSLKPGQHLSREQVAAVISLVAGSVGSLEPKRVSVVDQAGNLLSARVDLSDGLSGVDNESEASRRITDEVRRNAQDLLAPVLGSNNFKISVAVDVDNDKVEETRENYGGAPKVTNEASRNEQSKNGLAVGVPGSLSNRPINVTSSAPTADNGDTKNAMTRQYAYDRSVMQIKRARGTIRKLDVAVLLNNAMAPASKTGWTPAQVAAIDKVLRSGLGINAARGDSLVVSGMNFGGIEAPLSWWQDRDFLVQLGGWIAYAVGCLLVFLLIVRPLLKMLRQWLDTKLPPMVPATVAAGADGGDIELEPAGSAGVNREKDVTPPPEGKPALGQASMVPLLENYDLPPSGSSVDVMIEHLRGLAHKEPERVAEVIKQWVQHDGRSE